MIADLSKLCARCGHDADEHGTGCCTSYGVGTLRTDPVCFCREFVAYSAEKAGAAGGFQENGLVSYCYQDERASIFTEKGQETFLAIRDKARELLKLAGAFRQEELQREAHCTGDSWTMLACVDRLVELKEIVELPRDCWGQYKVYTTPQVHNR